MFVIGAVVFVLVMAVVALLIQNHKLLIELHSAQGEVARLRRECDLIVNALQIAKGMYEILNRR